MVRYAVSITRGQEAGAADFLSHTATHLRTLQGTLTCCS